MNYAQLAQLSQTGALQRLVDQPLPAFTALKLQKTLKAVREEFQTFTEVRNDKIEEYGEDGAIDPDHENWEDFNEDIGEVLDSDTDVDISPLDLDELPDDLEISASDLDILLDAGILTADE